MHPLSPIATAINSISFILQDCIGKLRDLRLESDEFIASVPRDLLEQANANL